VSGSNEWKDAALCPDPVAQLAGGGDFWSGSFLMLRISPDGRLDNWQPVQGSYLDDSLPLVVTREFKNYSIDVPGAGTLTENAVYKLTVKRAGPTK
jgi:hypothetical protein